MLAVSELVGVNVATVLPALKLTAPATALPPESCTVNDTVFGTTAWENVAVGVTETGLPVDPLVGVTAVTVGGVRARRLRVHHVDPVVGALKVFDGKAFAAPYP